MDEIEKQIQILESALMAGKIDKVEVLLGLFKQSLHLKGSNNCNANNVILRIMKLCKKYKYPLVNIVKYIDAVYDVSISYDAGKDKVTIRGNIDDKGNAITREGVSVPLQNITKTDYKKYLDSLKTVKDSEAKIKDALQRLLKSYDKKMIQAILKDC